MSHQKSLHRLTLGCLGGFFLFCSSPLLAGIDALTQARYDLQMALSVDGQVAQVPVKHGERVVTGQILLELKDDEGVALLEAWRLRSESELEIQSQQEKLKLAELEEEKLKNLKAEKYANPYEVRRAELTSAVTRLDLATAKRQHQEAIAQYKEAQARHERFILRAPRPGVVETLIVEPGESVEANKPILRLVDIDQLLIEAWVPMEESLRLQVGDPVWARHRLPGQDQPLQGVIISIGQVADSGSQTRMVRIELPNPRKLAAGGHVDLEFNPAAVSSAPGAAIPSDATAAVVNTLPEAPAQEVVK